LRRKINTAALDILLQSEPSVMPSPGKLHHIELYVSSLEVSLQFWKPFLERFKYIEYQVWDNGRSFQLDDTYIDLVQASESFATAGYDRRCVWLNHLAFSAASRQQVDEITLWARENNFRILYEDRHPFAGGPEHHALYCEDPDRIKVEVVAPPG
jgi:catechol 2,3-dioxygenase-like lactoylglutathione lyase family enzyme